VVAVSVICSMGIGALFHVLWLVLLLRPGPFEGLFKMQAKRLRFCSVPDAA